MDNIWIEIFYILVYSRAQCKGERKRPVPGAREAHCGDDLCTVEIFRLVNVCGSVRSGDGDAFAGGYNEDFTACFSEELDGGSESVHVATDVGEGGRFYEETDSSGERVGGEALHDNVFTFIVIC
jgi:hypothetical protein